MSANFTGGFLCLCTPSTWWEGGKGLIHRPGSQKEVIMLVNEWEESIASSLRVATWRN